MPDLKCANPSSLASTQLVADHLNDSNGRNVELIWETDPPSGMAVYEAGQIPGIDQRNHSNIACTMFYEHSRTPAYPGSCLLLVC